MIARVEPGGPYDPARVDEYVENFDMLVAMQLYDIANDIQLPKAP
jgi:hypothetical protein